MPGGQLCAQCRQRPVESRWRPFCSERCKAVDLGRWLSGDYRVVGPDVSDPAAAESGMVPDEGDISDS